MVAGMRCKHGENERCIECSKVHCIRLANRGNTQSLESDKPDLGNKVLLIGEKKRNKEYMWIETNCKDGLINLTNIIFIYKLEKDSYGDHKYCICFKSEKKEDFLDPFSTEEERDERFEYLKGLLLNKDENSAS